MFHSWTKCPSFQRKYWKQQRKVVIKDWLFSIQNTFMKLLTHIPGIVVNVDVSLECTANDAFKRPHN